MLETCLLVLLVILFLNFLRRPRQNGKPLPEPKGLPFFGLGLQINQYNAPEKVTKLAEEHGDIFQMNMFQQKFLCLNNATVIRDLLTGPDFKRHTSNRSRFFFGEYVLKGESISLVQNGFSPKHNKLRKGFSKAVHIYGEGMEHFEQNVLCEINELNKRIAAANGDQIDVVGLIKQSLTQVISVTETFQRGRIRGAIDVLLGEQLLEKESGKMAVFTDHQIQILILEILTAGIVTTWSVLSGTMICLVHHPEYQDRVYKQLMDVIGDNRNPTHTDKQNCPLVEALELEVHRLLTVVPLIPRDISGCNVLYKGYTLPDKATVLCNQKRIHHDEKTWGDPWNFRPDRFLDDNGQLLPRDHPLRQSLLPFGLGRRSCAGEQFARSRYFLYMATLLRDWRFTLPPGQDGDFDPQHMELFDPGVVVEPKSFNVVAKRR